jgi:DNA polymerase-3 subunit gamma/tau
VAPERPAEPPMSQTAEPSNYTVVARRYRPQRFEDVVGQDHVVQALRNAIRLNRVTHAYLFSGTRGVGKTSIARIFAKCLNCVHGPTDEPCLKCDICQLIALGQDVDVIEIDGASNNGVESVRDLRQKAGLRPSRARFKIYYIDEVHMLSTGAFNALLKTLEEPPEHVKFFFATTEANKIPVTVLSRCQRYDLAGIAPEQIVESLGEICQREKIEAEPEALQAIARRAGGSMRDAQSLLEQLLSSSDGRLTVEAVHRLLGTASDERLLDLVDALADRDAGAVLTQVARAADEGVQPNDLLGGVIDFLRDLMVLSAGAGDILLTATPRQRPRLQAVVDRWPLDSILAALQILSEARMRLRGSQHGRITIETSLVRVARLENLTEVSDLVGRLLALESGLPAPSAAGPAPASKKKLAAAEPPTATAPPPPVRSSGPPGDGPPAPAASPAVERPPARDSTAPAPAAAGPLELSEALAVWSQLCEQVGLRIGKDLCQVVPTAVAPPNVLVIGLGARYNWVADQCEEPEARDKIEQALEGLLRRPVTIRFDRAVEGAPDGPAAVAEAPNRRAEVSKDPMVRKIVELFEARPVRVEVEDESSLP